MSIVNAITIAVETAEEHLKNLSTSPIETRTKELTKLTKAELIELVLKSETWRGVKVEDLAKPILEDEACVWLDYKTIAHLIKQVLPEANTSHHSIATYASRYPKQKGWDVKPRKTQRQKLEELINL